MTYDEEVLKKGIGICIVCGQDLKNNALATPDAMKLISIEMEAYSMQKTLYTGPELWVCHKCAQKMAKNVASHAQRFNDVG
jgi:hypothetical protein